MTESPQGVTEFDPARLLMFEHFLGMHEPQQADCKYCQDGTRPHVIPDWRRQKNEDEHYDAATDHISNTFTPSTGNCPICLRLIREHESGGHVALNDSCPICRYFSREARLKQAANDRPVATKNSTDMLMFAREMDLAAIEIAARVDSATFWSGASVETRDAAELLEGVNGVQAIAEALGQEKLAWRGKTLRFPKGEVPAEGVDILLDFVRKLQRKAPTRRFRKMLRRLGDEIDASSRPSA